MSKTWSQAHSKAYVALGICIVDGAINDAEKSSLRACVQKWEPGLSEDDYATMMERVVDRLSRAKRGAELVAGIQSGCAQLRKRVSGDKKQLFQFIKELRSIAESDRDVQPVSTGEARLIRCAANSLGFQGKLNIQLSDSSIELSRI